MATINLLSNGGFERNSDWAVELSAHYVTDVQNPGNRRLRCTHYGSVEHYHAQQNFSLIPGKSYTVKFHTTFTSSKEVTVNVHCIARNSQSILATKMYTVPKTNMTTGTKSFIFTIPNWSDDRVLATILLTTTRLSGNTTTNVWLDNIEVLGDSSWFTIASRGSGDNQLLNGNFEENENWILTGNAVYSSASPYEGVKCLCYPINTSTNRQSACQSLRIVRGKPYTLSFMAKRMGTKDLWASITYCDSSGLWTSLNMGSLLERTCEAYTLQTYTFTINENASLDTINVYLNAGDYTGGTAEAYIDDVQLRGETPSAFIPGHYVQTKANARLYNSTNIDNEINYGAFPAGAKFILDGFDKYGETNLLRLKFGNKYGQTIIAYAKESSCTATETMSQSQAKQRAISIALSLIGVKEGNLGLGGAYCQNFLYWLCGATGIPPISMPYPDPDVIEPNYELCGPTRAWFMQQNRYYPRNIENPSETRLPQPGDFVYYAGESEEQSSHVGLVIESNESMGTYFAIEGDVENNEVRSVTGNYQTGVCDTHGRTVHGFAVPLWT